MRGRGFGCENVKVSNMHSFKEFKYLAITYTITKIIKNYVELRILNCVTVLKSTVAANQIFQEGCVVPPDIEVDAQTQG